MGAVPHMRRWVRWLLVPALAVVAGVAVATPSHAATGTCSVTYRVLQAYPNVNVPDAAPGMVGEFTVQNTGTTTLSGWKVVAKFALGVVVTANWNSVEDTVGLLTRFGPYDWNAQLVPGATAEFGFVASRPSADTSTGAIRVCTAL